MADQAPPKAPELPRGAPRPFKARTSAVAPARVFPPAVPTVRAAIDKPANAYKPAAAAAELRGAGAVTSGSGANLGSVSVNATAVVAKGKVKHKPRFEAPYVPPVAAGPVRNAGGGATSVEVKSSASPPKTSAKKRPLPPPAVMPPTVSTATPLVGTVSVRVSGVPVDGAAQPPNANPIFRFPPPRAAPVDPAAAKRLAANATLLAAATRAAAAAAPAPAPRVAAREPSEPELEDLEDLEDEPDDNDDDGK